jgi:RHS repeat-associated protein
VVEELRVTENGQPGTFVVTSDRRFLYDGWNVVAEFEMISPSTISSLPSPALCATYAWGLDLSGTEQGAGGVGGLLMSSRQTANGQRNTSLPTFDGNGNITSYVDVASAHVSQRREYDAFGNSLGMQSPLPHETNAPAFGFSSKYTDAETGLVYYGYRYYSPELGRWMARDTIEERSGVNLFAVLANRILFRVDYLGQIDSMGNDWSAADEPVLNRECPCADGKKGIWTMAYAAAGITYWDCLGTKWSNARDTIMGALGGLHGGRIGGANGGAAGAVGCALMFPVIDCDARICVCEEVLPAQSAEEVRRAIPTGR